MKFDYVVVGAGLAGLTVAERIANVLDKKVLIIEKRGHIGGNVYDSYNEDGVLIHNYGPHIFHTDKKEVYEFLSKFTDWTPYKHKVLARVRKDKYVPVPFNKTSLYSLLPKEKAERVEEILSKKLTKGQGISIFDLIKSEEPIIREFGEYVYKNVYSVYSMKQWGIKPEKLDCSVFDRVPVFIDEDDGYFTDEYQFMPKDGFTEMVSNILRHPKIKLKLKTDANKIITLSDGKIY
jgi:UDP-galactopyranose mutase